MKLEINSNNEQTAFIDDFAISLNMKVKFLDLSAKAQEVLRKINPNLRISPQEVLAEIQQILKYFDLQYKAPRMNSLFTKQIEVTDRGYNLNIDLLDGMGVVEKEDVDDSITVKVERSDTGFVIYLVVNLDKDKEYIYGKAILQNVSDIKGPVKKIRKFISNLERS